jgi:hypothetical protein
MQMRCVGKGVYHHGPGGIERPGDFGWRIDAGTVQIALFCPRSGVCFQHVHEAPNGDSPQGRFWEWDGNWERPTIKPSIGCDDLQTRCGQHMVITAGTIEGNTPGPWVRRNRGAN